MPDDFDSLHSNGLLEAQRGRFEEARRLIFDALQINPNAEGAHLNYGNVLIELNRYDEAVASYERALSINPDFAEALYNLGNAQQKLRQYEEAIASFRQALAKRPLYVDALNGLGNTLQYLNRFTEAIEAYDKVISIVPAHIDAFNNRGVALAALGQYEQALASIDQALALNPRYLRALVQRGTALQLLKREREALVTYEHALSIKPDHVDLLNKRGVALKALIRYPEALSSYDRALAVVPNHFAALVNRGNVLQDLGRYQDAAESYAKALAIDTDWDYLKGMLVSAKLSCGDWRHFDAEKDAVVADVRAGKPAVTPFVFLAISDRAADQLFCSRTYVRKEFPPALERIWRRERYAHERIRIAYLSADFRDHAVSYLLAGLFEKHDRSKFELTAISFGPDEPGEMRIRLNGAFERFIDVRTHTDRDVALLLRDLEVDIAVDLMGFTKNNRTGIFAQRPVPVQVNFLGYVGSMGADYIDYIIGDRFLIPAERQPDYAENVVYLPDTFQANDDKRYFPDLIPKRADAGLPAGAFIFCSFNNTYKITPQMFDVWMRLLHRVSNGVLWLLAADDDVKRNLRREAEARGVSADRLIFAPRVAYVNHLARYRIADLFLDSAPVGGGATASEALWCGLPLLAYAGEAFASRMAGSLLNAVGLPELITYSLKEYEAMAIKLATDRSFLNDIKAKLARNRKTQPLFNTDRFRRHIEAAYTQMWERYQRGEPPASFDVAPLEGSSN